MASSDKVVIRIYLSREEKESILSQMWDEVKLPGEKRDEVSESEVCRRFLALHLDFDYTPGRTRPGRPPLLLR